MDPKMDSGFLAPGDTLEDDYDVSHNLSPEEVLGVMDQLLCYEAAWLQGWPLSQTLFTSLHIDNLLSQDRPTGALPMFPLQRSSEVPSSLVQIVLRAYCIGVVKSCDMVIELIASQHYYEEEDFVTQTYNRNLLTDVNDEVCLALLDSACGFLGSNQHCK